MSDQIDASLATASAFLRAAGLEIDQQSGEEIRGHIAAGAEHQTPWGLVHGGLYATAIETACSIGASLAVVEQGRFAVGLANHTEFIRAHREGRLDVRAVPIHQGRTGQLWQCDLTRDDGKLVARGQVRLQNVDAP
jgi:1,4-dihydroxy-2-naphthoyl-CoA hydrolase